MHVSTKEVVLHSLLHVHYNNLTRKSSMIMSSQNKKRKEEVSLYGSGFIFLKEGESAATGAILARQHSGNKEGKGEKSYCFNHTKPLQRLVVESPRVLGASFFPLNTT